MDLEQDVPCRCTIAVAALMPRASFLGADVHLACTHLARDLSAPIAGGRGVGLLTLHEMDTVQAAGTAEAHQELSKVEVAQEPRNPVRDPVAAASHPGHIEGGVRDELEEAHQQSHCHGVDALKTDTTGTHTGTV